MFNKLRIKRLEKKQSKYYRKKNIAQSKKQSLIDLEKMGYTMFPDDYTNVCAELAKYDSLIIITSNKIDKLNKK